MAETSGINHDLAAAVGHAFRVERHLFRLHRPGQSRIFHCLVVHLIAMGARLVHDPRENHGFACFGFTTPGNDFTLIVFKSSPTHSRNLSAAIFPPDLGAFGRDTTIRGKVFLWNGQDISIDIFHSNFLQGYRFAFAAICTATRSSCSLSSGVNASPTSSASCTWRISISAPSPNGARLTHSIASSFDFTRQIQKPAIRSLDSWNGPFVTVCVPPANLTRAPFEVGWRPSPASMIPALASSSLYFPISVRSFSSGIRPASEFLSALTRIMNFIGMFSFRFPTDSQHSILNRRLFYSVSLPRSRPCSIKALHRTRSVRAT